MVKRRAKQDNVFASWKTITVQQKKSVHQNQAGVLRLENAFGYWR
jgi:hypothetical protein